MPFETNDRDFLSTSTDPEFISQQPKWDARLQAWLDENGGSVDDYAFFTFTTRYMFGYLVYDRETVSQVGLIASQV